jgi:hypothetical protein
LHLKWTLALPLALILSACDIVPVAVGVWDIETEANGHTETSVWTITEPPSISISGGMSLQAEEVEFAGSRLSWSANAGAPGGIPSAESRINFNGTVDGNRLFGTLYTQQGNFRVDGRRRQN